eukprot:6190888-Pleurochrysis_carterae.AAC.2
MKPLQIHRADSKAEASVVPSELKELYEEQAQMAHECANRRLSSFLIPLSFRHSSIELLLLDYFARLMHS